VVASSNSCCRLLPSHAASLILVGCTANSQKYVPSTALNSRFPIHLRIYKSKSKVYCVLPSILDPISITEMARKGIPSGIIRFFCLAPLFYLSISAMSNYSCVRTLDVFDVLPHGQTFLAGLRILGQAV
jgi:hypothetical protein